MAEVVLIPVSARLVLLRAHSRQAALRRHLIKDEPIVEDGKIVVAKVLPISLSFDHRVFDGAEAARFGNAVKKYIEDPELLEML